VSSEATKYDASEQEEGSRPRQWIGSRVTSLEQIISHEEVNGRKEKDESDYATSFNFQLLTLSFKIAI